jgi:hypothetical protein
VVRQGDSSKSTRKKKTGAPSQLQLKVNNQEELEDGIFVVKEEAKFRNEIQELMKLNAGIEEGVLFQTQCF